MATTPPNLDLTLALAESSSAPPVNNQIWQSLAGDPAHIPHPYSYCYYFSEGHLEQQGIKSHHVELNPDSNTKVPPTYLCRVISRDFDFQPATEEPVVRFKLYPAIKWFKLPHAHQSNVDRVISHSKVLTSTDLEELTVPDAVADAIFPKDHRAVQGINQSVKVIDVFGNEWQFERVFRSNRHLLTNGWKDFVLAKGLLAGDSIVFLKKSFDMIFVGMMKAGAISFGGAQEAIKAMEAADKGCGFEVTYYPRRSIPFVVGAKEVVESSEKWWAPGLKVRMEVGPKSRRAVVSGVVTSVTARRPEKGAGRLSGWNMVKVKWEKENKCRPWVNAWEITCHALQFGPLPLPQETQGDAGNEKRIRSSQETRDSWLRL